MTTHAGRAIRVAFVPDEETHLAPRVEVREIGRNKRRA
jgi:hypothetical protein